MKSLTNYFSPSGCAGVKLVSTDNLSICNGLMAIYSGQLTTYESLKFFYGGRVFIYGILESCGNSLKAFG